MIKVSVIVPVYKLPSEYLRACLNSLIAQTMQKSEFILVADGAPEVECSICEEYASKDARFKFFKREHAGVSATRNYGIEKAQGEYITFVDADDWIEPETCDTTYTFAKKNNSDIVFCESILHENNNEKCGNFSPLPISHFSKNNIDDVIRATLFTESIKDVSIPLVACKLIKRNIIIDNDIRYSTDLQFSEDRLFNIQCYQYCKEFSYTNQFLYHYRIHTSSATRKFTPNAYNEYVRFISFFPPCIQKEFSSYISHEILRCFFLSWSTCYMHKNNNLSYIKRMQELRSIAGSIQIQEAIVAKDKRKTSPLINFELFLFKKKLFFPIYLHGLKALIWNGLK